MVGDHIVEEIRARADIVEIISEHVQLKRTGKSYRGPCPLHGGDGPNFAVDPDRGIFKCFVCNEGGDVFGFLMKHLGLDFPTAVRQIGARVGVEVPDREEQREDPYAGLRSTLAFAAEWFEDQLTGEAGAAARQYLQSRGISLDEAKEYRVGCAPDEWRALRDAAHAHGIEDRALLELGLLATSERADEPYDRFRGRLMFTILDLRDRPIGFGGRILNSRSDAPKYINSPESPVFHKGEELYGLNWARHHIRREGFAALAEGFTDVMALHRADIRVAVAGLGTAFTRQQADRLKKYADRVYLLYDSDRPGLKATFRTGDVLLAAGIHPMVVTLPDGDDPDSLVRERGPAAIRELFDDAVDVLERKLQILRREGYLDRVEGRRRAVDGLLSTLRAVRDPALRDIYLDRAADGAGVRRDTLVHEIARSDRSRTARPRPARVAGATAGDGGGGARSGAGERAEHDLALLLVRDPTLIERAERLGLDGGSFLNGSWREVFEYVEARRDSGEAESDWSGLSSDTRSRVASLLEDASELLHPDQVFEAAARRLIFRRQRDRLGEIDRELALADAEQQRRLLIEKQDLAARLRDVGEAAAFMPHAHAKAPQAGPPGWISEDTDQSER
ncbi:MAG: DNA primase [Gemmatimonadota bacterium]|nr:DNA primase [Gemmatimonadota bacterium]